MFDFKFTAALEKHDSSLGWYYIIFIPDPLVAQFGGEKNPRVNALFDGKIEAHISVKSKGDERFLVVKGSIRKELGLIVGQMVHIHLKSEESKYGMPIPEELEEMLGQEEEANKYFHLLTPGKQRTLIYLVLNLKSTDARIRKALGIVEHLVEFSGQLDFKLLNEKFKEVNNRFK